MIIAIMHIMYKVSIIHMYLIVKKLSLQCLLPVQRPHLMNLQTLQLMSHQ